MRIVIRKQEQTQPQSGGANADDNIQSFVDNGVPYAVAVKVSNNGETSFEDYASSGNYFQGIDFSKFSNLNPISFIDPDGRKAESPDSMEGRVFNLNAPEDSFWWAYAKGGQVVAGSGDSIGDFFVQMKKALGISGGGSTTVGETQWFKDVMAQFSKSPNFQFPKGQEEYYKKNYPAFYDLVKNQLPNMVKDENFLGALSIASGFSTDELKEIFTYGKGMYLKVMYLPFGDAEYLHGGLTEGNTLNTAAIQTALADWFEKANKDTNSIEGLSNLLYVTANIAHETAHWGDDLGKRKSNYEDIANFMLKNQGFRPTDVGNFFEYKAFGLGSNGIGIGHYNTKVADTITNYVKANFNLLQSIFKTK